MIQEKRVLLVMPTFWDVIAPPVGLVTLKSYLEQFGHKVKVVNLNLVPKLWGTQYKYFEALMEHVPYRALVPRIGSDLLGMHMNAKVFKEDFPEGYYNFLELILKDYLLSYLKDITGEKIRQLINKTDKILDEHFDNLLEQIHGLLSTKSEYVGCTTLSSTLGTAMFLLREIKKKSPEVKTIMGGPGPYLGIGVDSKNLLRFAEKCCFVDKIIYGEGENVLKKYIEEGHEGKKIISAKDFGFGLIDMESLPHLDYSTSGPNRYFNLGIGASRGCPFNCAFCAETRVWGKFRKISVERLVEEVKVQLARHNINKFFFVDSLLNHSITSLTETLTNNNLKIEFDCYLRIDKHTEVQQMTDVWAKGGLNRARIGMECASADLLKVMNKGTTPRQQEKTLQCLRNSGVRTTTYWIVGHPHETEKDFQETLDFIKANKDNIYEADMAIFLFYSDGENNPDIFSRDFGGVIEKYPSEFDPLLIFKYYKLKDPCPNYSESFDRAVRFVKRMEELGVPCNRSSAQDFIISEKRWKRLCG
jgi:hypothetical protein